jgi:septal ring factor EnvC (AmiA/AmiB activator)
MTKIEQLESELNQKIDELNESLNAQYWLHERLKSNTKTLGEIERLLKVVAANLQSSNEYIDTLKRENRGLKLSCDVWMNRAIKLEFEVLSARDAAKK